MIRHVLITGVSSGIGRATAHYLCDRRIPVIGSVRNPGDAEALSNDFPELFHEIVFDQCDRSQIQKAKKEVESIVGDRGLGGLVNNAGIAVSGPMQYVKEEYLRKQMEVNFFGLVAVTQEFLPLMGAEFDSPYEPGRLINISSVAGLMTRALMGPYSASKHAVEAVSDAFRRELSIFGIQVVIIEPGPIDTVIWEKARSEDHPYMDTDYAYVLDKKEEVIKNNESMAIPAEKVAKKVYAGLTKRTPQTRYLVSGNKFLIQMLIHLFPDKWVDYLFTRILKKHT